VTTIALLYARWEYRKRGKLTGLGLVLLCAMLLVPNLILEYATTYKLPGNLLDYIGMVVGGFGIPASHLWRTVCRILPQGPALCWSGTNRRHAPPLMPDVGSPRYNGGMSSSLSAHHEHVRITE
jgi:hypothetical protein